MAHPRETRHRLRKMYVFQGLSLEIAAASAGISYATAQRWKRDALAAGDDWEKVKAANILSGGSIEETARSILTGFVMQYQTTIEMLNGSDDKSIPPEKRVELLASLADAFNKSIAASRRILPETDRLAIALEVIKLLAGYIREHYPKHVTPFYEILDAFGPEITQHYGNVKR
jgi:tRNA A37 N6-isopentenylltransferase MiaA